MGSTHLPCAAVTDEQMDPRNEFLEHLQRVHGDAKATTAAEERDVRSVQNRLHIQAEVESRRHARRLRRQQADMAAAVAGAVVGVCVRDCCAAFMPTFWCIRSLLRRGKMMAERAI